MQYDQSMGEAGETDLTYCVVMHIGICYQCALNVITIQYSMSISTLVNGPNFKTDL